MLRASFRHKLYVPINDRLLARAISGIPTVLHRERITIFHSIPEWTLGLFGPNGEKIERTTRRIVRAIENAGAREVLNGPTFTWEDICSETPEILDDGQFDGATGISVRFYSDEPANPGTVFLYTGQSTDLQGRSLSHDSAI